MEALIEAIWWFIKLPFKGIIELSIKIGEIIPSKIEVLWEMIKNLFK